MIFKWSWEAPCGIMQVNNGDDDSEEGVCKCGWNYFNSRWYSTEGVQRCLRSLMVNAKQVELGFPAQNLQFKSISFVFDFCCLGFVYCFGALVLHAWGTVLYNVCKCEECRWNSLADLGSLVLAWSSDWCEFNSLGVELYTASHHNTIYIRLHGEDGEDDCIYQIWTSYTLAQKDPLNRLH